MLHHRDDLEEDSFFPDCPVVDPHHHLFPPTKSTKPIQPIMQRTFGLGPNRNYERKDMERDMRRVNVVATVHAEAGNRYDASLAPHLRSLGETRFLLAQATGGRRGGVVCRGLILGGIDFAACSEDQFIEAVEAHTQLVKSTSSSSSSSLYMTVSGVRASLACAPAGLDIYSTAASGAYLGVVRNARVLGERFRLPFDVWLYAHQLPELYDLASKCPHTTIVCDHIGTPLVSLEGDGEASFARWKHDIKRLSTLPNVHVKLGGMGMHCCFGKRVVLAGQRWRSDDIVRNLMPHFSFAYQCFGADRVMFEGNYPMDSVTFSYESYWSAAKKMARLLSPTDLAARRKMLYSNANKLYALQLPGPEPALSLYAFGDDDTTASKL